MPASPWFSRRSILLIALAFVPSPAAAAFFTVTKTADTNDGLCDADCSLREAIGEANALPGADTVTVPAGTYTLSIAGADEDANATGDLDITDDLTINGAGAVSTIVDGGALDRVFHIGFVAEVAISDLTVQNGFCVCLGGGIENEAGTATLTNITVKGNSAWRGGGIHNRGTFPLGSSVLVLNSSTVSANSASDDGTGNGGRGGGIDNDGLATLNNSTVSGNSAGWGGGIQNTPYIPGIGGGNPDNLLILNNSTVSGNSADVDGGIVNRWAAVLNNSTVSGNSAESGSGIHNSLGSVTLKQTIVANNQDDCGGVITSAGHNLSSDATCSFTATGDLQNTDPLLGPLTDNGGPTQTHALLPGSPAIDAADPVGCPSFDQRGWTRTPPCDIGAYEADGVAPIPMLPLWSLIVLGLALVGLLRNARRPAQSML